MSPIINPTNDTIQNHIFDEYRMMEIKRFSISSKPLPDLRACLLKLKKDALRMRALYLDLNDADFMKKAELVDAILQYYQVPQNIEALISWATDEEKEILKQILNKTMLNMNNETLLSLFPKIKYLMTIGLVTIFESKEDYIFALDGEVLRVLQTLNWEKVSKFSDVNHEISKYARAAVSLYGAVSLEQFYKIYRHYKGDEKTINTAKFIACINDSQVRFQTYWSDDENLYSDFFDFNGLDHTLLSEILFSDKPYYLPAKAEFMNYSDVTFEADHPELDAMMAFLMPFGKMNEDRWDDLRISINYSIEFGRLQDTLDELDRANVHFNSDKDIEKFMPLYMRLANSTRLWVNRGHTPDEIRNLHAPAVRYADVPSTKVGRNAPCPCGSGKKYKKCCGGH